MRYYCAITDVKIFTQAFLNLKLKMLYIEQITKSACRLHWQEPETDGGSAVSYYVICMRKRPAGSEDWAEEYLPWETNVPSNEHVVVDLIPNKYEYTFR